MTQLLNIFIFYTKTVKSSKVIHYYIKLKAGVTQNMKQSNLPFRIRWSAVHPRRQKTRGCKDYSHSIERHCATHATSSHRLITAQLLTRVHLDRQHLHWLYRVLPRTQRKKTFISMFVEKVFSKQAFIKYFTTDDDDDEINYQNNEQIKMSLNMTSLLLSIKLYGHLPAPSPGPLTRTLDTTQGQYLSIQIHRAQTRRNYLLSLRNSYSHLPAPLSYEFHSAI